MNIEEILKLAREAGYGDAMSELHQPALERFANAVIKAHEAKLIEGAGEPVLLLDTQTQKLHWTKPTKIDVPMTVVIPKMPLYTEAQVAGVVAKKDAEIEGWKADQKENMQIQVDQHQRIATLESALKVALEALDGADSSLSDYYAEIEWGAYDLKNLESVRATAEQIKEVLHAE